MKAKTQTKAVSNDTGKKAAKELFLVYQAHDDAVTQAKVALEDALVERSKAVAEIATQLGKGPFSWNGETIVAVKRDLKEKHLDGTESVVGATHFFKSIGAEVQKID